MKNRMSGARLLGSLKRSVGIKLFFMFFCTIVVLVSILGVASYTVSKNVIKKKVAAASLQTVVQASDKLDFMFGVYEGLSRQLLVDQDLSGQLVSFNKPDINTAEKTEISNAVVANLNSIVASDQKLFSVRLVPKNMDKTKIFYSKGASSLNITSNNKIWLDKVVEGNGQVVYIPVHKKGLFELNTEPTMMIGRLLKNLNNKDAEYILLLEVKDQALTDVLSNVNIAESGQIMILNNDNHVVHTEAAELLESESALKIPDSETAEEGSFFTKDEQGNSQLVVYKQTGLSKWKMVGSAPVSELVKETKNIIQITMIIAILSALVSIGIGLIMIRMVAKPLVKLSSLMEEGEKGNLSVRTNFKGQDEIGRLGQSFNQMMGQISLLVEKTNDSAQHVLQTAFELSEVSQNTSTMAKEVAVAVEEIAQGAMGLSMEAENGMNYADNIGMNMNKVIDINSKMEGSADRVYQISNEGTGYMGDLITKTNSTEELTRSMIGKVDKLKDSTSSIRKILEVLTTMAQQTNILSLNASIEAVRAGAAGKGFMVIADEIRKLSDQSKVSISVVQDITNDIQKEVEETVDLLLTASPLLTEQIRSVKEASTIFDSVREEMGLFIQESASSTASIRELNQSQLILSESISNVSAVAEQSSAASEEVASIATEQLKISEKLVFLSDKLENLSETLKESLVQFHTNRGE
ncbi:methyl-accepting chemotaxis protein [Paenibacillus sp. sgz500992]|uniref:methyl-accepting chemotaxis protein n=1 Tax=Paenibacillus sp. sgz500992 TaxID=3242476 RepID=UPI0036D3197C